MRLINYMEKHNIIMRIMKPSVGQYSLKSCEVEINQMKNFISQYFEDNEPESIRYYYTIHDDLMDIID